MACLLLGKLATAVALLASQVGAAGTSSYNGLAITPAMGWDNWNAFGCTITEELLLNTAQKIVDYGLRDLGKFELLTVTSLPHRGTDKYSRLPLYYY